MSKISNCPTCGAKCKTKNDKAGGDIVYSALQDEDAFNKIQQLKEHIQKLREEIKNDNASC